MSGIRYPEEFKIEALKQVTDRGYKIGEVAKLRNLVGINRSSSALLLLVDLI